MIVFFTRLSQMDAVNYYNKFAGHSRAYARGGGGGLGLETPAIGLSTKMHSKENITFLALLSLFFCNDTDFNMI